MKFSSKIQRPLFLSIVLFLGLVCFGYFLSLKKPLWNDEIVSQTHCVDQITSYPETLFLGCRKEGNNFPLFYLIQKMTSDAARYHFPFNWREEWNVADTRSQFVLRIPSNLFMSAALTVIFFFFASRYSLGWGIYSFLVGISSVPFWMYWVEARPYFLWFFLTTVQTLLFLNLFEVRDKNRILRLWLPAVHIALSLTIFFSVIQNAMVCALIWVFHEKNWKKYIFSFFVPALISLYFYATSVKFKFFFADSPLQLLLVNFSTEKIIIVVLGSLVLFWKGRWNETSRGCTLFLGLLVLMAVGILGILKLGDNGPVAAFAVSSRYFIFLTPVAVILATLLSREMIAAFKGNVWMRINLGICLSGLIILGLLKTLQTLNAIGIYG